MGERPPDASWCSQFIQRTRLIRSCFRLARLPSALRRADVVLVLREVLPVSSLLVERVAARRAPVVWDVDDALWTQYPRLFMTWLPEPLRRSPGKYARLAGLATEVWAGSEVLADWCRPHARSVHVVPTVVDVGSAPASPGRSRSAVWVGSPSTAGFLEQVLPYLRDLEPPLTVECVGATGVRTSGVQVHQQPWSEAAEREVLSSGRVGLYPIDIDHPLGPGKAGLKAVLYMANGVPSVVTPTASVRELVRDGVEGFHASTPEQWRDGVQRLANDDELWRRMSDAGRRRALEQFSLQAWGPWVAERIAVLAVAG